MKESLNAELIKFIKERLPEGVSTANYLMNVLSIGKEAVYRRLRGDVPFTFYESSLIAKRLGLSLDEVAENTSSKGAMFSYNLHYPQDPMDYFYVRVKRYADLFYYINTDPSGSLNIASNVIPYSYYYKLEHLTKFKFCRWLHQLQKMKAQGSMDKIIIPERITETIDRMGELMINIPTTNIILDKRTFKSFVFNVHYFEDLGFISHDDLLRMKDELYSMLNLMEESAAQGQFHTGKKINLYLSNIDLDGNYSYLEKDGFILSLFRLYEIDNIYSHHPEICEMQKQWILSLRRYSTLISLCGEKERSEFFIKQREIISAL